MAVTNGYADGTDVQALFNSLGMEGGGITLGAATTPTLAQVEDWLDSIAAEVDAVLVGRGYSTVPATGTNDIALIGRYVAQKAACTAYGAGFMYDDLPNKVQGWCDEWKSFITRLEKGALRLIDQTPARGRMGTVLAARYIED